MIRKLCKSLDIFSKVKYVLKITLIENNEVAEIMYLKYDGDYCKKPDKSCIFGLFEGTYLETILEKQNKKSNLSFDLIEITFKFV